MTSSATIDCPRCHAHYRLSGEILAAGQQPFHCGVCDHLFSAHPVSAQEEYQEVALQAEPSEIASPSRGVSLEQLTAQLEADLQAEATDAFADSLSEEVLEEDPLAADSSSIDSEQEEIESFITAAHDSESELELESEVNSEQKAPEEPEVSLGIDEIQNLIDGISAEGAQEESNQPELLAEQTTDTDSDNETEQKYEALSEPASTESSEKSEKGESSDSGQETLFENVIEELAAEQSETALLEDEEDAEEQALHEEQNFDELLEEESSPRLFGEPKVTLAEPADTPTTELSPEERQSLVAKMNHSFQEESRIEQLDLGLEATLERLPLEDDTHELGPDLRQEQESLRQAGLNKLERERVELELERKPQARNPIDLAEEDTEAFIDLLSSPAAQQPVEARSFSLGFLCLPVFFFLCLLGAAGYFLSLKESELAVQIARALSHNAPRVPPAGLRIRNTKFEQVRLSSGDSVPVIRGTIYNDTTSTFQAIQIEGVLFDKDGKPQRQLKTNAGALPPDIENYTVDMISAQQAQAADKRFELSPGSSQRFIIALPGSERQSPGFYTARIYSAKS